MTNAKPMRSSCKVRSRPGLADCEALRVAVCSASGTPLVRSASRLTIA